MHLDSISPTVQCVPERFGDAVSVDEAHHSETLRSTLHTQITYEALISTVFSVCSLISLPALSPWAVSEQLAIADGSVRSECHSKLYVGIGV